jgi:ABC-2 type transport system ATP-binding protein
MEDVKSLCLRSVVITGGEKLYDGATDALFSAYQTHRKVTIAFESETAFRAPDGAAVLESDPYRAMLMLPRERSGGALAEIMRAYAPKDIVIEEEDIGDVVERIYAAGGAREKVR